jgi:hypothetical protein
MGGSQWAVQEVQANVEDERIQTWRVRVFLGFDTVILRFFVL